MRIMSSIFAALIVASLSTPALACDRHGGGWGGHNALSSANWSSYDEYNAQDDLLPDSIKEQEAKARANQALAPRPSAKPSFSKASVRASDAAQARLSAKARLADKTDAAKTRDEKPAKG